MSKSWSVSYIVGLCPKIVFREGQFMFSKEEAERIAEELRKANPKIEFHVHNLQPNKEKL